MRKHKTVIFLTLGFLIGISVLLYPVISDFWNGRTQSRAIVDYESVLETMEKQDLSSVLEAAHDYNRELGAMADPLLYPGKVEGYNETLNVAGDGMIGYLSIERIGVELPIYHGTSDVVLGMGVGHLEGSSLPVGGESTHSVMSAHRGLPGAKLFTDLDRVERGDTFQITVLDQVLTYQVEKVKVVKPTELYDLQITEGEDRCTLFTCTPYGINTHRLLVQGVRVETVAEKPIIYVSNEAFRIEPLLVTPAVAAPMLLVLLIHLLVKYRDPPKKASDNKNGNGKKPS